MQGLTIRNITLGCLLVLAATGCKKDIDSEFELQDVAVAATGAEKDKMKTDEQYVAILYTNLFQAALSANDIFDVKDCITSIGDKELAREVIISNFMNKPGVLLPSVEDMEANLDQFIEDTYVKFYVRYPTEGEKTYLKNFFTSDPYMTPELVYFSFALSNEYMFY